MSKIFEALQFAHAERIELDKLARQVSIEPKGQTQVLAPAPAPEVTTERAEPIAYKDTQALSPPTVPEVKTERAQRAACNCEELSHRIRRQGIWDVFLGLLGLYPWKCAQCQRHFHRSRRY